MVHIMMISKRSCMTGNNNNWSFFSSFCFLNKKLQISTMRFHSTKSALQYKKDAVLFSQTFINLEWFWVIYKRKNKCYFSSYFFQCQTNSVDSSLSLSPVSQQPQLKVVLGKVCHVWQARHCCWLVRAARLRGTSVAGRTCRRKVQRWFKWRVLVTYGFPFANRSFFCVWCSSTRRRAPPPAPSVSPAGKNRFLCRFFVQFLRVVF